ncbi:hypothetical protein LG329_11520 [Virgibacillus necropolis]|uniref:hypothetical protein n=1 Tax=Virgibacillus necropolis TaxID=163877 RepID=UPI00384FFE1E
MTTFFFTILPIIILAIIFGFVVFITNRNAKKKRMFISGRKIQWIFGAYFAVLLISVGLFFMIPTEANSTTNMEVNETNSLSIYVDFSNGNVSRINSNFIDKQWSFEYEGDKLSMKVFDNNISTKTAIFVGGKSNESNTIDATYYQTPTYVGGIDVTNQIKPPGVNLTSETLTIDSPERTEFHFNMFKQEFPVNQFIGEEHDVESSRSIIRGEQILYIRIPKDIKLLKDNYAGIEYIDE